MTRRRSFAMAWLTALAIVLAGCGDGRQAPRNVQDRAEQVAAEARSHMDALADRVGTDPQVTQDVLTDCVPGQRDSGLELIYSIDVTIEPDAMGRISSDVAETYRDDG